MNQSVLLKQSYIRQHIIVHFATISPILLLGDISYNCKYNGKALYRSKLCQACATFYLVQKLQRNLTNRLFPKFLGFSNSKKDWPVKLISQLVATE